MIRIFIGFAVLFGLLATFEANALDFEVTAGITDFDKPDNGTWYQEEFPNSIADESFTGSVGVNIDGIGFGYKYLGYASSDALATASDINYAQWRSGDADLWPLSSWHGRGYAHGIYLTYTHTFDNGFFVGGGAWAYQALWGVSIPNWRCATSDGQCVSDFENAEPSEPQALLVGDKHESVNYTAHVGYSFGDFSLRYEVWNVTGGEWRPVYEGLAQSVVMGVKF